MVSSTHRCNNFARNSYSIQVADLFTMDGVEWNGEWGMGKLQLTRRDRKIKIKIKIRLNHPWKPKKCTTVPSVHHCRVNVTVAKLGRNDSKTF